MLRHVIPAGLNQQQEYTVPSPESKIDGARYLILIFLTKMLKMYNYCSKQALTMADGTDVSTFNLDI